MRLYRLFWRGSIDSLLAYGGTNFEDAIQASKQTIGSGHGRHTPAVLLFTDGANTDGDPHKAIEIARELRNRGSRIFAVATEDSDIAYLIGLTGDPTRVISTRDGRFEEAFAEAAKMISASQLMQSDGSHYTYVEAFLRASGWTVFLCLGIALALVAIQNHYLKKPLLPNEQWVPVLIASILAGFVAGFVGQFAHTVFDFVQLGGIGRILAWTALGALLARGMVFFIPNLDSTKALAFGAFGGFLGAIGFLFMTGIMGDMMGRFLGAFILGACIGLLIAIVEQIYRNVWLMVLYDPRDFSQVNLGDQEVTAGSGKMDTVHIADAAPQAGRFQLSGDNIRYTDAVAGAKTLKPGDRVRIGKVELVICSKDVPFSPSRFYPMKMTKAREIQQREREESHGRS